MNEWYEGAKWRDNFVTSLAHWLAIFSEGNDPIVPIIGNPVSVAKTFESPCFRDFPESEKSRWIRSEQKEEKVN